MILAASAEMLYLELPLQDRVSRLHERGFAVELWGWPGRDPASLRATGARFTSVTGYVTGDLLDGADELLRTAEESIGFAHDLGCPTLNLHGTGLGPDGLPVRATPVVTGANWLQAEHTLSRVARLGRLHSVTFVLENLNTEVDHPDVPFARAADTLALVASVDDPHLRLNLDLYHAQIGEGNLVALLRRAAPYIGEVQIADVPGRCEPGTGEVRWAHIARELSRTGYDGVVALEAWSSDPSTPGTDRALEVFRDTFTVA
jgi:hydroxypyruvate isomerase